MFKKAQNAIEIALMAAVVVVIALSVMAIYNNQKINLAEMSQTNKNASAQNGAKNKNAQTPLEKESLGYSKSIETAGALSLVGMSSSEFNSLLSKLSEKQLQDALSQGSPDMLELANKLGANINDQNVDSSTVDSLVKILNDVSAVPEAARTDDQKAYVDRFNSLLNSLK